MSLPIQKLDVAPEPLPMTPEAIADLLPLCRSLMDCAEAEVDHSKTLLANRWLCEGGGAFLIGPSGHGKSVAINQACLLWSAGKPAFGIKPARPLKIVLLQTENDDGDVTEALRDIPKALGLTAEDCELVRANTRTLPCEKASILTSGGRDLLMARVADLAKRFDADLIIMDNWSSFFGDIGPDEIAFELHRVVSRHLQAIKAALMCIHHPPKTTNRDTTTWSAMDFMYSGAGSAQLTNWARAILVIEPVANGVYRFIAAKRGERIGWVDEDGRMTRERCFRHASGGRICWLDADEDDVDKASAALDKIKSTRRGVKWTPTAEDALRHAPAPPGTIEKSVLEAKLTAEGSAIQKAKDAIKLALNGEILFEHRVERAGKRPAIHVSRIEQQLV